MWPGAIGMLFTNPPLGAMTIHRWQCTRMKPGRLFEDDPAPPRRPHDCAMDGHTWIKATRVFDDEPEVERLIWICQHCPAWRGRVL